MQVSQPLWDGNDIKGLTILLYGGSFGDAIQFIRYASLVAQSGAKVIFQCHKELIQLLKNVEGTHQVITDSKPLPKFDVHCSVLSLPMVFNSTLESIPAKIPYVSVDPHLILKWRDKVKYDNTNIKVGLVWSSAEGFWKGKKSCSLELFQSLAQLEGFTFFSVQKGIDAIQAKNPPKGIKLIDYTDEIHDFSDTAALIENLDLVISVDTAVAHLAGALGKPVWTLLDFASDWRWLKTRDNSPWYPTMRLFRQPSPGNWKTVIERVAEELGSLKENFKKYLR